MGQTKFLYRLLTLLSPALKFFAWLILFWILFDSFIRPIFNSIFRGQSLGLQSKDEIYVSVHLFLVALIFLYQEVIFDNQKGLLLNVNANLLKQEGMIVEQKLIVDKITENLKKQEEIIFQQNILTEAIGQSIKEMSPFKKIPVIFTTVKMWLEEEQPNVFIFYFPYAIAPGFWYDKGDEFIDKINTLFSNKDSSSYPNKLHIIGSDYEDSPFSNSIEILESKLDVDFIKNHIEKNGKFYTAFEFRNYMPSMKQSYIDKIKEAYLNNLKIMESHAKNKDYFNVMKIGKNSNCGITHFDNLPSFSFILKINKNKAEEMILIDTFNILPQNNVGIYLNDLGISSIKLRNDPERLITLPEITTLNNHKTGNLFLTTFLETCCQGDNFAELKQDIRNLNEIKS